MFSSMRSQSMSSKTLSVITGVTVLIAALDVANLVRYTSSAGVETNMYQWKIFAAADTAVEEFLPNKLSYSSTRPMYIKGQEKYMESSDMTDRELIRKRGSIKKRGANTKKRTNKKRVNLKRGRRNGSKKKTAWLKEKYSRKKKQGGSRGKKKTNLFGNKKNSFNNKKNKYGNKKKTSKASKRGGKSQKSNDKWYPKFDSIMCASGGGRPIVGFNPMYYADSRQTCCVRHFPSMATECMIRSAGGNAGAAVISGAKPTMWGSGAWMGDIQPVQPWWAGAGGKSGKSTSSSTTIVYINMPEKEDEEGPTTMPTTYLPTYNPSTTAVTGSDMPTFTSTFVSTAEKPECSNINWFFWGAEDGIGGSIANDQETPEIKEEPVLDVSAGSRYTLLVDSKGDAFASGFIESKYEYLGQFGVESNKLEDGQNEWRMIEKVADVGGRATAAPPFAKVYAGASANSNSGEQHSLLIDNKGNVYTFGNNNRGQLCLGDTDPRYIPNQVSLTKPAIAAALGEDFTLILLEDGTVYGCGSNEKGELGLGDNIKAVNKPNNGNGLNGIVDLTSGLNYAMFQSENGDVYTTGSNMYSQHCKDTNGEPVTTPEKIISLPKHIQSIVSGSESSYFLFTDGTVASCGRNDEGQLGDGTFIDQVKTFAIIPNKGKIIKLGSGPSSQSVFFVGDDNFVYGAGNNDRYQLGLGKPGKVAFPSIVAFEDSVFNVLKISSSGSHTVSINELLCTSIPTATPTMTPTAYPTLSPTIPETNSWLYWGANEGRGETLGTNQEIPELIDHDVIDVTAGPRYTLIVDVNGDAFASGFIESKYEYLGHFGVESDKLEEGSNSWQQIDKVTDIGGKESRAPPFAKVYAGASATANSGEQHSLFLDEDGNVYTAGNNDHGQLCLGDTDPRYIPNQVNLKEPAIAAALGEDFTLILLEDGTVYGCGSNEKGELGLGDNTKTVNKPNNGNGLKDIFDISAGLNHALFQTKGGNVFGTGSNIYMQLCEFTDGEPITSPKIIKNLKDLDLGMEMIMAGRESSYFLLDDGSVKSCGRNDEGQLGDGTFINNEFADVNIPKNEKVSNLGSGPSSQSVFFWGENEVFGAGANDQFQLGLGEIGSRTYPVRVEFDELYTVEGIIKISSSGTQTVALNVPVELDVPIEANTTIPTFSPTFTPTSGGSSSFPTFSPSLSATESTYVPTFSPTFTPTSGGSSSFPTFSPTFGLTSAIPTSSPTYMTTIAAPTSSPTYMTTIAAPTSSPTYMTTIAGSLPTSSPTYVAESSYMPTSSPTYVAESSYMPTSSPTYVAESSYMPTSSPTYLGEAEPTFIPTSSPTNLGEIPTISPTILTATALYVSGDPAAVGEAFDGVLQAPADANEIILDAASGSRYTLVVLSDGSAAAGGLIDIIDDYQGHLGVSEVSEGVNELTVITSFTDKDGNTLAAPPKMAKVFAGVETSPESGLMHSIFIDEDGKVYASGNNDKGQLCLGDTDSRDTPVEIDLSEVAVSAAVGGDFTLILTENGKVFGCGNNANGQIGLGSSVETSLLPNDGNDLEDVTSVSAGLNFALFMADAGLFVTGDNTNGQLCIDPATEMIDTPSLIADVDGNSVDMFEAGYQSAYLLFRQDGSVAACGLNDLGQLGDGTTETKSRTAVIIPGEDTIINLGIGGSAQSAFFLSKDAVYATGLNDLGQLGIDDANVVKVSEPTEVVFSESAILYHISPGETQTLYW